MYNEHNGKFYNPLFSFHLVLVCNALREHHKNYYESELLKFFQRSISFKNFFPRTVFCCCCWQLRETVPLISRLTRPELIFSKFIFLLFLVLEEATSTEKKLSSATTNSSPPTTSGGTNSGPATWSRTPPVWPALRQLGVHRLQKK